jgi:hypothetical protein
MAKRTARRTKNQDVLLRSAELIGWAIGGLEREIIATRQKLEALTRQASQLRSRMSERGGRGPAAAASFAEPRAAGASGSERPKKRRQMSAAARKRISDMQKKRWAEWRKKKAAAPK